MTVDKKFFIITGEWHIDLASKIFDGFLADENGNKLYSLHFKIPISAIVKFGISSFEEAIENDIRNNLTKKEKK